MTVKNSDDAGDGMKSTFNVCEKVEVLIFYSDSSSSERHDVATILLGLEAGNGVLCEEVVAFLELNPVEYFDTISSSVWSRPVRRVERLPTVWLLVRSALEAPGLQERV